MAKTRFEYAALPLRDILALATVLGFEAKSPGGYVSDDAPARALDRLLRHGYRWVRTEGEFALFEREAEVLPLTVVVPAEPTVRAACDLLERARGYLAHVSTHTDDIRLDDAVARIADTIEDLADAVAEEGA
jgi:hypothetical protein